ncbi:MAG: helix-turn-helix transcriptional regulator [Roseburia sp.]|nr:helix-turn-helix transcriptional regulator [Roseburia sp.]
MSTIGERIEMVRKEAALTQKEFADSLGITQAQLSAMERKVANPSLTLVKLISCLYAKNENWILEGEEKQYSSDGETDDARTRIEIRTIDNSLFTELYIDGHRVDGVRGFKLEQTATLPARLTVDLSYLDVAIDQQCVLYSKSPDRKIKEIIWAKESE